MDYGIVIWCEHAHDEHPHDEQARHFSLEAMVREHVHTLEALRQIRRILELEQTPARPIVMEITQSQPNKADQTREMSTSIDIYNHNAFAIQVELNRHPPTHIN